ncbi:killer cell lectin-like receptor subfamily G member 1 [Emydura macquarii macquarii]|uniref:killer cell lectin-like receptor subfamily G member 1 n=1 Tax=Emydura macquarii macquarii TaxID=1129001 RepID=UPI00352A0101
MEGSRAESSAAEMSEEIIYTSVRFSRTPPVCTNDVVTNRAHQRWSSVLCSMAMGAGILIAVMLMVVVVRVVWRIDSPCPPGCPDKWVGYSSNCYFFSKEKKDWNSSQTFCSAEESKLLVISDAKKMDLFSLMKIDAHWIGLRNRTSTGWVWEDGSKLNKTKVISNSPVQHCGVLWQSTLQASSCEVLQPWICEKSLK